MSSMAVEVLTLLAVMLFFRFVFASPLRRAMPERYTIRYLLFVTMTVAVFLGICLKWAPH